MVPPTKQPRRNFDQPAEGDDVREFNSCMRLLEETYDTEKELSSLIEESSHWNEEVERNLNKARRSLRSIRENKWELGQRHSAFGLPTLLPPATPHENWDIHSLATNYQRIYDHLLKLRRYMLPEKFEEMREKLVNESIIMNWPQVSEEGTDRTAIGSVPLIMRTVKSTANNVKSHHPELQLCVLALNKANAAGLRGTFEAILVTQKKTTFEQGESSQANGLERFPNMKPFGKLVAAKKQGRDGTKDKNNKRCTEKNGHLVISRKFPKNRNLYGLADNDSQNHTEEDGDDDNDNGDEQDNDDDSNSTLCASFPNLGVKLKDADQLYKNYKSKLQLFYVAVQCELYFNEEDRLSDIKRAVLSHPFVVAPFQEHDLIGHMMREFFITRRYSDDGIELPEGTFKWGKIKHVLRHLIQSKLKVRPLDDEELLHIQCMIFLPKALDYSKNHDPTQLELEWFEPDHKQSDVNMDIIKKIKHRLLKQFVRDETEIEEQYLLKPKCIDLRDCNTELKHSVFQWLYMAIEMIADRLPGNKICPDPKDNGKSQRSMMRDLFENRTLTMSSKRREWIIYKSFHHIRPNRQALLIRFCDWQLSSLSIAFTNEEGSALKPKYGVITADELRDYEKRRAKNGGLVGLVMTGEYPSQFNRIVQFHGPDQVDSNGRRLRGAFFMLKQMVFPGFKLDPLQQPRTPRDPLEVSPVFGPMPIRLLAPTIDDGYELSVLISSSRISPIGHALMRVDSHMRDVDEISDHLEIMSLASSSPSQGTKL